ncbi:hypothetical protein ACSSS7_004931 [Eimeria intestinalis]
MAVARGAAWAGGPWGPQRSGGAPIARWASGYLRRKRNPSLGGLTARGLLQQQQTAAGAPPSFVRLLSPVHAPWLDISSSSSNNNSSSTSGCTRWICCVPAVFSSSSPAKNPHYRGAPRRGAHTFRVGAPPQYAPSAWGFQGGPLSLKPVEPICISCCSSGGPHAPRWFASSSYGGPPGWRPDGAERPLNGGHPHLSFPGGGWGPLPPSLPDQSDATKEALRKTAIKCFCVFWCLCGVAFAFVPLYEAFCSATGYGGALKGAPHGTLEMEEVPVRPRDKDKKEGGEDQDMKGDSSSKCLLTAAATAATTAAHA